MLSQFKPRVAVLCTVFGSLMIGFALSSPGMLWVPFLGGMLAGYGISYLWWHVTLSAESAENVTDALEFCAERSDEFIDWLRPRIAQRWED